MQSSPDRAVRVLALAGGIVLCSGEKHVTLSLPLFTQVYEWVPATLILWVTLRWISIPSRGGVEILLVASCYGNRDKLRPHEPLSSYADFAYSTLLIKAELGPILILQNKVLKVIDFYG